MPPVKKKPQTKASSIISKSEPTSSWNFGMLINVFKDLLLTPNKTIEMKIVAIVFGFVLLTLGIFTLVVTFWAFRSFGEVPDKLIQGALGIPLSALFIIVALKMIYLNLREI